MWNRLLSNQVGGIYPMNRGISLDGAEVGPQSIALPVLDVLATKYREEKTDMSKTKSSTLESDELSRREFILERRSSGISNQRQ